MIETRLPGAFGATLTDIDLAAPRSDQQIRAIVDALFRHRVLLIPGQRLSRAQYVRFGAEWGTPISFFVPGARDHEFPEIIRITNSPATPEVSRDGAMHWHSDSSYEAEPAAVTMLYPREMPAAGNATRFADSAAAYAALPDRLRAHVDRLAVIHDPRGGKVTTDGEVRGRGATRELPRVTHPLVATHPVTGRRSLFGFSGTAAGIVDMAEDAAIELLLELKEFALQPRFRQEARAGVDDVLIWDNWSVVHSATRTHYSDRDGERRLVHRISTRGIPQVYADRAPRPGHRNPAPADRPGPQTPGSPQPMPPTPNDPASASPAVRPH
ncbi:TauD/TfdA family dioxygenase [Pseudofrankia sp. BMG5.36]|uniref:TauD/TfdA family dioxygenase n=1 Tax=Pseudofrankia sp. BMG5.36 TaxID=1834512 RepID=UPI0008DA8AF1|nr:TauD/TfdA family dioxygenase [Pseudofrankia sp. BMG5.36]OHV44541.1 hypothetical protein BCD48_25075 [Pseudofrankia sp. BMG5.36]